MVYDVCNDINIIVKYDEAGFSVAKHFGMGQH